MIAGGGAAGAVCRFCIAGWVQRMSGLRFPTGTLTVNMLGCFILGFLGFAFSGPVVIREEFRFALLVGFLGAFTTFSTYGFETFNLLDEGQRFPALLNILISNGLGLTAVWLGCRIAGKWYGG